MTCLKEGASLILWWESSTILFYVTSRNLLTAPPIKPPPKKQKTKTKNKKQNKKQNNNNNKLKNVYLKWSQILTGNIFEDWNDIVYLFCDYQVSHFFKYQMTPTQCHSI